MTTINEAGGRVPAVSTASTKAPRFVQRGRSGSTGVGGAGDGTSLYAIAVALGQIAVDAGLAVMDIARQGFSASLKPDASPVTEADVAAERLIVKRLASLLPGVPIVAEECTAAGARPEVDGCFLLVDPLDGTREFIAGRSEFTVNLALIENQRPVAGAIYAPALQTLWYAGKECFSLGIGPGASLDALRARPVAVRQAPEAGLVALVSRSHYDPQTENYLKQLPTGEIRKVGSSLKFCLIAQGDADLYPRFGQTCEWDTAAGHAILAAAGGDVTAPDGLPLRYGNRAGGFRQTGFVAWGQGTSHLCHSL
jgi:3'(2'), 5'-bisphosphate nucleotidase